MSKFLKHFLWGTVALALSILLLSCKRKNKTASLILPNYNYNFNMNAPSEVSYISKKLKEISGLTFDASGNILAINDEKGIIFKLDATSRKIIDKIDFGKNDDYEGIAFGDNKIFIVESNGNIKVVSSKNYKKLNEYNTKLSAKNDIEGAFYESENGVLLLASKSQSKSGTAKVFRFNTEAEKITDSLKFGIDIIPDTDSLRLLNMVKHVLVNLTIKHRLKQFAPSGIACDPLTGEYYILSSRGKLLVILNEAGTILAVKFLSRRVFGQPEGIAFDVLGNLYISNEAKSHQANILKFDRIE